MWPVPAQTLQLAELLDKQGQTPSSTDDGLSVADAAAIDRSMLHVMDLCKLAMSLGDLDVNKLISAADGRCAGVDTCTIITDALALEP